MVFVGPKQDLSVPFKAIQRAVILDNIPKVGASASRESISITVAIYSAIPVRAVPDPFVWFVSERGWTGLSIM